MGKKILLVEDEPRLRRIVKDYLSAQGYETYEAGDGISAIKKFEAAVPDMVILDIMLPGIDGFTVAERLREKTPVPIIMLTAKSEEEDTLRGLENGADDYMTKPFSLKELEARMKAVFRRFDPEANAERGKARRKHQIMYAGFEMDAEQHILKKEGQTIKLTPIQFSVLRTFLENPGTVFTREHLLENSFKEGFENLERTIDVHIKNLRKAIEPNPAEPTYVKTVWGVGYRFAPEEELE